MFRCEASTRKAFDKFMLSAKRHRRQKPSAVMLPSITFDEGQTPARWLIGPLSPCRRT
jgi:hypothetical protein